MWSFKSMFSSFIGVGYLLELIVVGRLEWDSKCKNTFISSNSFCSWLSALLSSSMTALFCCMMCWMSEATICWLRLSLCCRLAVLSSLREVRPTVARDPPFDTNTWLSWFNKLELLESISSRICWYSCAWRCEWTNLNSFLINIMIDRYW